MGRLYKFLSLRKPAAKKNKQTNKKGHDSSNMPLLSNQPLRIFAVPKKKNKRAVEWKVYFDLQVLIRTIPGDQLLPLLPSIRWQTAE